MNIDISNFKKSEVLAALYNNSKPLGLGILHYEEADMTIEEAEELINENKPIYQNVGRLYFDYVKGRVIKVDLTGDSFNPALYDRDNGDGAAKRVIEELSNR